jgi:hypothetical protein
MPHSPPLARWYDGSGDPAHYGVRGRAAGARTACAVGHGKDHIDAEARNELRPLFQPFSTGEEKTCHNGTAAS